MTPQDILSMLLKSYVKLEVFFFFVYGNGSNIWTFDVKFYKVYLYSVLSCPAPCSLKDSSMNFEVDVILVEEKMFS